MTLPPRKLGGRLRSALALVLLAIVELRARCPLLADASMRSESESAAPEAPPQQDPEVAHSWQPTVSTANGGNYHARPRSIQAVREFRDSILTHLPRRSKRADQQACGRCFRTFSAGSRLPVQRGSPPANALAKPPSVSPREWQRHLIAVLSETWARQSRKSSLSAE